jgi:hypothetical protein
MYRVFFKSEFDEYPECIGEYTSVSGAVRAVRRAFSSLPKDMLTARYLLRHGGVSFGPGLVWSIWIENE